MAHLKKRIAANEARPAPPPPMFTAKCETIQLFTRPYNKCLIFFQILIFYLGKAAAQEELRSLELEAWELPSSRLLMARPRGSSCTLLNDKDSRPVSRTSRRFEYA